MVRHSTNARPMALANHEPGVSYHGIYTAYVSSAPRTHDNGTCTESLIGIIEQVRTLLPRARVVVVFDGRSHKVRDDAWQQYEGKKAAIRAMAVSNSEVDVVEHAQYLHQSVGLRSAMNATDGTPFVFVAQDDVMLYPQINVSGITWRLAEDAMVRYVKLFPFDKVDPRIQTWNRPGTPHPADKTLFRVTRFSDRPHFAHRALYAHDIWPHVREDDRGVPETLLRRHRDGRGASWREEAGPRINGLWFWAPPGSAKHESHNACGRTSTFKRTALKGGMRG